MCYFTAPPAHKHPTRLIPVAVLVMCGDGAGDGDDDVRQTRDNVFVTAVVSVQYQPIKEKVHGCRFCSTVSCVCSRFSCHSVCVCEVECCWIAGTLLCRTLGRAIMLCYDMQCDIAPVNMLEERIIGMCVVQYGVFCC